MISPQASENLHILMPPALINIYSFWDNRHCPWQNWSRVHRTLGWIEISLKMVEQDGLEYWSCSSPQEPKLYTSWGPIWSIYVRFENIDIRNDGNDLVYIEYYAGYKSALYWWRKMVLNVCNDSTDVQSTASTEILQTFPMTNLINICSFWEYRHSPWRHCSRGHRILCWIEIGLKLVEKGGLEFLLRQHLWSVHSKHRNFTHHHDDQFDLYMFVLSIWTFDTTALISCTSNTMLDRNRP